VGRREPSASRSAVPAPLSPDSIIGTGTRPEVADLVKHRVEFWDGVLLGLGAEPRAARSVPGASGVEHQVISIGVDDSARRLLVVSAETDAQAVALAQADIQTVTRDYRVIAARPLVVSASEMASALTHEAGDGQFSLLRLMNMGDYLKVSHEEAEAMVRPFLPLFRAIDQWTRNANTVSPTSLSQAIKQLLDQISPIRFTETADDLTVDLSGIIDSHPGFLDSQLGICGFPVYKMTDSDIDIMSDHRDLDLVREKLQQYGVYQFFYPPPDQLLLGAIERGASISRSEEPTLLAERLGHPAGRMELVPADTPLPDLIDALQERKLLVSGEVSTELTPEGVAQRALVKFAPREGIVSKIINRISVSIDLKQILGLSFGGRSDKD
jgi:hypothetical protein